MAVYDFMVMCCGNCGSCAVAIVVLTSQLCGCKTEIMCVSVRLVVTGSNCQEL